MSLDRRLEIEDWAGEVTTTEFGTVTKAEALGRISTHTAYHAGQFALANELPRGRAHEVST